MAARLVCTKHDDEPDETCFSCFLAEIANEDEPDGGSEESQP